MPAAGLPAQHGFLAGRPPLVAAYPTRFVDNPVTGAHAIFCASQTIGVQRTQWHRLYQVLERIAGRLLQACHTFP